MARVLRALALSILRAARGSHATFDTNQFAVLHRRVVCLPGQPRHKLHTPLGRHVTRCLDLVLVVSEYHELPTEQRECRPLLRPEFKDLIDMPQHTMEVP